MPEFIEIPQIHYDRYGQPVTTIRMIRTSKRAEIFTPIYLDTASQIKPRMNWKIVCFDACAFSERLSSMFGIDLSTRIPNDGYDGLFFFSALPSQMSMIISSRETPKIIYWTGSDAKLFMEGPKIDFGENTIHITDSPWLVIQLCQRIPFVRFVPLPPELPHTDIEIDENPGIFLYLNVHGGRDIERTKRFIRCIRDIPIYISHGQAMRAIDGRFQDNIIDLDWIPDKEREEKIFRKVSVHVRLMHWDGISQTVVEMKMLGRHVFYTTPMPYCEYVGPDDPVEEIADRVRKKINSPVDIEGAEWYRAVFAKENFIKTISELCKKKNWSFPYEIVH